MGSYYVVIHPDTASVQVSLWEQFGTLPPKPTQFDAVAKVEVEVDGEIIEKPHRLHQPGALRWLDMK